MLWTSGNIELRIWPLDHCPPHVTAVCRANDWTARFMFSMVVDEVSLWDIKPKQNAPTWPTIRKLARQIDARLALCREQWWRLQKTVCLDHAPVQRHHQGNVVVLAPGSAGSGRVVKGSGIYLTDQGVQARVDWGTSTTTEWLTGE